jgi:tetratricopeptide (TPR) repeat protein
MSMLPRPAWLWLCALCAVWHSPAFAQDDAPSQARRLWGMGQEMMRQGKPAEAIRLYEMGLALDGSQKKAHLSLAAACVECHDEAGAVRHLAEYLDAYPEHHVARVHYAELLMRLHKPAQARAQFERFVADVQDSPELAGKHLVHCYSRLMEIAVAEDDEYAEHLNRGIGLYLLACERAHLPEPDQGELSVEAVLCKAAGELTMARMVKRDEARPCWYLYAVWSRLDQRQPALRHLREADATAPFSYLTPAERRDLELARLGRDAERR